ncbi:MAG TPA: pyrroline-5-carboxylate reductase [Kribbella sp.]|nr:pyrroline-5-carboxylate reductase [Kribbella sp.]
MDRRQLVFIGGGNLGTALVSGLLGGESPRYAPDQIQVVESSGERAAYLRDRFGIATPPLAEAVRTAGTVLIAVKPHHVDGLLADLAGELTDDQLLISAAGGVRIGQIEQAMTTKPAVVRCMPNTPAAVGEGMIALAGGTYATPADVAEAEALLRTVGRVVQVAEPQLDAITAISGSGPAYFFYLAEALVDAAVLVGLPRPFAEELVTQTAFGAGMMLRDSGDDPVRLRAAVSSPGGTTIAAVREFENRAVRSAVMAAAEAARDRSIALAEATR